MARRRILDADIKFLSLVPRGANGFRTIYKAEDETVEFRTLCKASEDLGEITALVYAPESVDKHGDIASQEVVRKMAHTFARNGFRADLRHNEKALSTAQAYIAESFIVAKGDTRFAGFEDADGRAIDATGGWGVILKIDDPALRAAYRSGEWAGVSMFGPAKVKDIEVAKGRQGDSRVVRGLRKLLRLDAGDTEEGIEMNTAELTKALNDQTAALTKAITDALGKPAGPAAPAAPAVDLADPVAVRKHLEALELSKIDLKDPVAVRKHLETLEKKAPTDGDKDKAADKGDPGTDSAELLEAKAQLKKAQDRIADLSKASNAPTAGAGDDKNKEVDLSKADSATAFEAGKAAYRKARGDKS